MEIALPSSSPYSLLPFRFMRLPEFPDRILMTSEVGEHLFLSSSQFDQLLDGRLTGDIAQDLEARHFIYRDDPSLALRLLGAKLRTRKSFLRGGPSLHIFVVTLRCDHACHYCQVSRRNVQTDR